MANNIEIKEGTGGGIYLKTTELTSNVHSPHHIIQEISGSNISSVVSALNEISASVKTGGSVQIVTSSQTSPVWVTASLANPIPVTGSINVDVQISDLITVTSSLTNPVGITGSTTINNLAYTTYNASTYTSNVNAFTLVGSSSNRADVDSLGSQKVGIFGATNNRVEVDISGSQKVGLFGSNNNRAVIDTLGSLQVGVFSSAGNRQTIDSSGAAQITGSATINNVSFTSYAGTTHSSNVNNISLVGPNSYRAVISTSGALSVTSSNANPIFTTPSLPTGTIRKVFSTSDSTIDFNDITNLGSFQISANDTSRKGLLITNPTSNRLFISIATQASSSTEGRNGFNLPNNNNDPVSYSFIIYPSGSYFADVTNVTQFYGGFFVSSSNQLKVLVTETY